MILLFAHLLSSAVLILNIYVSQRKANVKLAWSFSILFIPIICTVAFFIWGRTYHLTEKNFLIYKKRKNIFNFKNIKLAENELTAFQIANEISSENIFCANDFHLISTGNQKMKEVLDYINQAKTFIYVSYYIFSDGILMNVFLQSLRKKAEKGVKIYIIYDGLGSIFDFTYSFYRNLLSHENIFLHIFKHPKNLFKFFNINFNYRYHRKLIIIDGEVAFFGGFNLGNEYISFTSYFGYWKDTHFLIKNEPVAWLQKLFEYDWNFITKQKISFPLKTFYVKDLGLPEKSFIKFIDNGPEFKISNHLIIFLRYIENAQKSVKIITPYLICPKLILETIIKKAKTTNIEIIIPEVPDKKSAWYLTLKYAQILQKNNVKIYFFANAFIHTKMCIIDEHIAFIGSVNLDNRSLFQNYELMAIVTGKAIDQIQLEYQNIVSHSHLAKPIKRYLHNKLFTFYLKLLEPIY